MRLSLLVVLLAVPVALADDARPKDKKTVAREIKVKGLPTGTGVLKEPTKITTKEQLEKAITDKDLRETILKEVDLDKEFLLFFQWGGSGGDKLQVSEDDSKVTFTYSRGSTDDLRRHTRLYALPNKTEYKLSK